MSSRSGSRSRRQRSREPRDEYPPLPVPRLPPLRSLASQRERDNSSPTALSGRPFWSSFATRRAERIRNLDLGPDQTSVNDFQRALDQAWGSATSLASSDRTRSDSRQSNLDDLAETSSHLHGANSHLRALLEMPSHASLPTSLSRSSASPPPHLLHHSRNPPDLNDSTRRSKRRKLDSDRLGLRPPPFRYGKYGQVEPGQLLMEIMSCDGGMFSNEASYASDNILKDDGSVYCTKGNRCNIVLHHQGGTAFTLQELIIKGPTSMNYSHPIREGMVFVTMEDNAVLARTAEYQIQYAPANREPSWVRDDNRETPRNPLSVRHDNGTTTTTRVRRTTLYRGDDDDYRIAQMPPEFSSSQLNVGVSTECSDEDHGDSDIDTRRFRRPPNRIGSLPFENMDSDDEYDLQAPGAGSVDFDDISFAFGSRSATRDHSSFTLSDAWNAAQAATQDTPRTGDGDGELLAPHARFLIEKRKSTCTIRFDPPVSGRYILLKMWNSHHDPTCNIDIQSVIARGFAGPRFFPSLEMR